MSWVDAPLRTADDVRRFEQEKPLNDRLPGSSVFDVFRASAEKHADRTALTMLMTGAPDEQPRRVSYQDLLDLIRRAANLFSTLGGERPGVAYMLPSLIETHATLWGAETAGYAVPINFLLNPEHIAELLEASNARILVALGPHPQLDIWQKALKLREINPQLTLVRVAPPEAPAEENVVDFATALMQQPADELVFGQPQGGDSIAAYFHTGGTTGLPKLVQHTHAGQLAAALGGAALSNLSETDIVTATLPLFHVAGTIFTGLGCFMAGSELVVTSPAGMRNPTMVREFWRICERHRVTLAGSVPTAVGAILEVALDGADISTVRAGLTGAASMPPAIGNRWREVTGTEMKEVYGMTEASGLIAINPFAGSGGEGSVGLPLPYSRVTVRRLEADGTPGGECDPGEIGVLTVRGPTVSPGYREAQHDEEVFVDGELNTGDLAFVDEAGRIHIAGRAKDLIIRSGHNIDPLMIENAMTQHPAVAVAAAVGMPDAYAGELPVCYVTLNPGVSASEDQLQEHAKATINERPAWPKRIFVIDEIPLTNVGKIYKPQLRCDAVTRLVNDLLLNQLELPGTSVVVSQGGRRGMKVTVTLPDQHHDAIPQVETELSKFLFELIVMESGCSKA